MDTQLNHFVWDSEKEIANIKKHGISFFEAIEVFKDSKRKIVVDTQHSQHEE